MKHCSYKRFIWFSFFYFFIVNTIIVSSVFASSHSFGEYEDGTIDVRIVGTQLDKELSIKKVSIDGVALDVDSGSESIDNAYRFGIEAIYGKKENSINLSYGGGLFTNKISDDGFDLRSYLINVQIGADIALNDQISFNILPYAGIGTGYAKFDDEYDPSDPYKSESKSGLYHEYGISLGCNYAFETFNIGVHCGYQHSQQKVKIESYTGLSELSITYENSGPFFGASFGWTF